MCVYFFSIEMKMLFIVHITLKKKKSFNNFLVETEREAPTAVKRQILTKFMVTTLPKT